MNTIVTSRKKILSVCRELVADKGLSAVNMRTVAEHCHVALGSLYYYFPSKDDLLIATIESVWADILKLDDLSPSQMNFAEFITQLTVRIKCGINKYPNFFTAHAMSLSSAGRAKGCESMQRYLTLVRSRMLDILKCDAQIDSEVFTGDFSREELVDFILVSIMAAMSQRNFDYVTLIEVIKRTVYPKKFLFTVDKVSKAKEG